MDDESEIISVVEMKKFVTDCFVTVGVCRAHSEIMSEAIVGADVIGHHCNGVYRLSRSLADVQKGYTDVHAQPKILKETPATAWVDGQNALGPLVGNLCVKLAIAKAKTVGAAIVVANNSNNFGAASNYSYQASQEGLIGLAFTNSSALMLPTRAKYAITGTNPISAAAPALFKDSFLLDMATTVASGGNIEMKSRNCEYLPKGWAANAACIPETNGDVALKTGRFLPIGSSEEAGSYKGTGLSIMVDILCGVLAGAAYCELVGTWTKMYIPRKANVGHCFIVINPKFFAPDFEMRMSEFLFSIRNAEPKDPNVPVRVAGDRRLEMNKFINEFGGIRYPKYVVEYLKTVSQSLQIKCVPFIPKPEPIRITSSQELLSHLTTEREISIIPEEFEGFSSEEGLSMKENAPDPSFIVKDSSDWLCPFSDENKELEGAENILEKKRKQSTTKSEMLSNYSSSFKNNLLSLKRNGPSFARLDEIVETESMFE